MAFLSLSEAIEVAGARPELLSKLTQLMTEYERRTGKRTFVPKFGGVRSPETQARLDRDSAGAYPVAAVGSSFHEYGAAFDLNTLGGYDADGYRQLAEIATGLGLVAGYYWKGKQQDVFHFQLDESLATTKERWAALQKKNSFWRSR